jgi:hypothetical protein
MSFFSQCEPLLSKLVDGVASYSRFTDRCMDVDPMGMTMALHNAVCTVCGNGEVADDEECDEGSANSNAPGASCRTNCRRARCGDDVVDPGELCDDGMRNSNQKDAACRLDCKLGGTDPTPIAVTEFTLEGSAMEDTVLKLTTVAGYQIGQAYVPVADETSANGFTLHFKMYTGGGSGADGQCVNVGGKHIVTGADCEGCEGCERYGANGDYCADTANVEDGVTDGLSLCFDEWASGENEHGIDIFYNGAPIFEARAMCENLGHCVPVSLFEADAEESDPTWHDVVLRVSPAATETRVAFTLDAAEFEGSAVIEDFALPSPAYLSFSGRTGGATNNHWVKGVLMGP